MLDNVTPRTKLLLAVAAAIAVYVVAVPDNSQTIEPVRGSDGRGAASVMHVPAVGRSHPTINVAFHPGDRVVGGQATASLFSPHSWYVAPPPPPPAPVVYQPPPAPTAPPLPFTFMGSYQSEDAVSTFFLTAGDRVYDVKVGDTLNDTYSVDGVDSGQLLLTYLPLKIQQSIAIGGER